MIPEEFYMGRALELARLGSGYVSPNPMVGCVIVVDNKIIGEGWHHSFGSAHAEVNAIHSVGDQSLLNGATLFVNLEPCNHHGKTPPCTDLLISKKLKRVVIGNADSNPVVAGQGIKKLQDAGIDVTCGVLEKESRYLNRFFLTFHEKKRPYVILKWAETADGFIAKSNYDSKWISNQYSRQLVHKLRSEVDASMIGGKTASVDNPSLTTRDWTGHDPKRVVIDRFLKLSESLKIFSDGKETIVLNEIKHFQVGATSFERIACDASSEIFKILYQKNILSILVEGGRHTLSKFIDSKSYDEAIIFQSPRMFKSGIKSPHLTDKSQHFFVPPVDEFRHLAQ
ncbi:MAG: bifunctional diaminohydroxyphosphoribosylaminopyrimidine deaminase/5-amino-6-(5-phosphoribosylamino)uracil reductase RibD [Cytophagales bacterium]